MGKDVILGIVRHILTTGGGFLAAKGFIDATEVEVVVGALIALGGFVWSFIEKRNRAAKPA